MKTILRLVLLAAIIAAVVWLWGDFFPSPQKIIRKHLTALADDASFDSKETPLAAVNNTEALVGLFATNVEINLDVPQQFQQTFDGRDEIKQAMLAAHSVVTGLKVKFLDPDVEVGADKTSATADLTVQAQVSGQRDIIIQEWKFTLQKIGGDWLITRVETIRTLS